MRDLGLIKPDQGVERLTVAGLLSVGRKEQSINKLLPQAEVIYLHYGQHNLEEYDARLDMKQPDCNCFGSINRRIQTGNRILNVQVGLYRVEIPGFFGKVFQEAILNALAHRDYQSMGAVYVKQYPDKLVIENPGGFLDNGEINHNPSFQRQEIN